MRRFTGVMVIVGMVLLSSVSVFGADPVAEFRKAYEETEILTAELFEGVSNGLSGNAAVGGDKELIKMIDKLLTNSDTLEKTAQLMNKQSTADEARQMASYLNRIKKTIKTGKEKHYMTMLTARYYVHYNNCIMTNTFNLKLMQQDHVEELKIATGKNDWHEIVHLAEHLHVHCDQMNYSSMIFGKTIWSRYASEAKVIADKIFEAAQRHDTAIVAAGVKNIEGPVEMLGKIIKK